MGIRYEAHRTDNRRWKNNPVGVNAFRVLKVGPLAVALIELQTSSGLPIELKQPKLFFGEGMKNVEPSVRTIDDMKSVLLDGTEGFSKHVVYHMYRNVGLKKDVDIFNKNRIRYDITVVENGTIGKEFVKTVGHYHPIKAGTNVRYTEIYEVLYGNALVVMQQIQNDERIENVFVVTATAGEKVVLPPGCGHVTVNTGKSKLVLANLVSTEFVSIYDPFKAKRGESYYVLRQNDTPMLSPNKLYETIPNPEMLRPKEEILGISKRTPLYTTAQRNLQKFRWLNYPEFYREDLEIQKLFDVGA
jgi:glucose-6-phosphate isomerase